MCELGVLPHADGSALLQMGNTKVHAMLSWSYVPTLLTIRVNSCLCRQVLAAVFGPHEPTSRGQAGHDRCTVHCEYAMAAFSTGERRRRGKSDRRIAETVGLIRAAVEQTVLLELMPRSQVDITLQVRQVSACFCMPR